jgi:hypothetical protein
MAAVRRTLLTPGYSNYYYVAYILYHLQKDGNYLNLFRFHRFPFFGWFFDLPSHSIVVSSA